MNTITYISPKFLSAILFLSLSPFLSVSIFAYICAIFVSIVVRHVKHSILWVTTGTPNVYAYIYRSSISDSRETPWYLRLLRETREDSNLKLSSASRVFIPEVHIARYPRRARLGHTWNIHNAFTRLPTVPL